MSRFSLSTVDTEWIRLTGIANDAAEQLAHLEARAEAAREFGHPGPSHAILADARKLATEARRAAEQARRRAKGNRRGTRAA